MSTEQSCKRTLHITVPAEEVERATEKVVRELAARVRVPGFRPGKVPPTLVRTRFAADVRQALVEELIPKFLQKKVEEDNLRVVGTPDITRIQLEPGQPMQFTVELEVAPEIELKPYRDLTVPYRDPVVTEEEVHARLEAIRERRAEYVTLEPRPAQEGDYAAVALESFDTAGKLVGRQEEVLVHIGSEDTLPEFTENLRGMSPGEEKEFEVRYPDDYGDEKLAGKTLRFHARLKAIRRKELPELNDEFAAEVGDFRSLDELREEIRRSLLREKEFLARQEAKNKLVEQLVALHDFPVPEAFLDQQLERQLREFFASRGVDPRSVRVDWQRLKESQRDRALLEVKASLLLDKIADREGIEATVEEVDREVQRLARQERENVVAMRRKLEQQGALRRIASRIRAEKTLDFLFEHARKVPGG
ncbi:MAG: trigger factor [Bryobacterales bacterium]|nr:trigger factor [Bryobacteraceae bacterium]MDW8355810.1 trigger factor [Bryobacterales bacterium]